MSPSDVKKNKESIGLQRMNAILLAYNVRTYIQTLVSNDQAGLMLDALSEGIDTETLVQQIGPDQAEPFLRAATRDHHDTIRAIAMIAKGEKP